MSKITMVGYPIGLWDRTNNRPVFRRGITASHPAVDWEGRAEFLIDAACFPGSSGSPVLIVNETGYKEKNGPFKVGQSRAYFLGVQSEAFHILQDGKLVSVPIPTAKAKVPQMAMNAHVGRVIKARQLAVFEGLMPPNAWVSS